MGRNINKRKSHVTVSVIVDGKDEKWYLENLKRHYSCDALRMSKINPELPQHKKIDELFLLAKEKARAGYDNVILIVDLDGPLNDNSEMEKLKVWYDRYVKHSGQYSWMENLKVIINSPCLEYWYLLHFKKTNKFYQSYADLLKDIKKINQLSDYDKDKDYYNGNPDIFERLGADDGLATARQNAASLGDFCISTCREKGMTEMDTILDYFDSLQKGK